MLDDLLFSYCDVPITVYFVLLILRVSLLFKKKLLMCFNSYTKDSLDFRFRFKSNQIKSILFRHRISHK